MESTHSEGSGRVLCLAFGLPLMTTAIVLGSMYVGHIITTQSDRPPKIDINVPQQAPPKVDINVPQQAPPNIEVSTTAPRVDVHVPAAPPPAVTVTAPATPAPNITVNPAPPTVTIIDRRDLDKIPEKEKTSGAAEKSTSAAEPPPASVAPAGPAKPAGNVTVPVLPPAGPPKSSLDEDPTLETLYVCATQYIEAYCRKRGLDPSVEGKRWHDRWRANLDQAVAENIDSGEQSYINRVVLTKRDYFDLDRATPEKIVEACRILLRYRDGQLAWLQAMKDAMTKENLKKTVTFLAAGP